MPIDAPRTRDRDRSSRPIRFRPSSRTWPRRSAVGGSRPITPSAVADLPEPDSPTMPRVRPGNRSKLTPRTASTGPASEGKETRRSRTESTGVAPAGEAGSSRRGVVRVIVGLPAAPVTEVGSRASRNPSPMNVIETVSRTTRPVGKAKSQGALVMVVAPSASIVPRDTSGVWTPNPRKESAVSLSTVATTPSVRLTMSREPRLGMMWRRDDAQRADAHELRGRHVVPFAQRGRDGPDDPGGGHPAEHGQHDDQDAPVTGHPVGDQGEDEERGDDQQEVDDGQRQPLHPAAEVRGARTDDRGDQDGEDGHAHGDHQRAL